MKNENDTDLLKSANSPIGALLLFILLMAVGLGFGITWDYWKERIPLWLAIPLFLAFSSTLVGAQLNKRWSQVGRLVVMGVLLPVLMAGVAWFMSDFVLSILGASGSGSGSGSGNEDANAVEMVALRTDALMDGLANVISLWMTCLFGITAFKVWLPTEDDEDEDC